jgi:hypothetical protein
VKCWGFNYAGQLGDGTTTSRNVPVDVPGLGSGVAAIAAGAGHTCALRGSGGVRCWGDNESGQLGDGTLISRAVPVDVELGANPRIVLRSSKPAGTIARGTTVTFTATVRPGGTYLQRTVRFVVYRRDGGAWRVAASRDVATDANGRATLRWGFATAGQRYLVAQVLPFAPYAGSAWTSPVRYTVR